MNWLTLVIKYLPFVIQGVMAVEAALKGAPGATKKAVVMAAVQAGAAAGEAVPEAHVAGISKLVDSTVSALNATNFGGFVKPATSGTTGSSITITTSSINP